MKRTLLTTLCALALAMQANAGDYKYLVLEKTDGTQKVLSTTALEMTFSDGNLVTNGGETIAVSQLSKMYFSMTTGISELKGDAETEVSVFSIGGSQIGTFRNLSEARATLGKGVYVMKQNGQTYKYVIR